MEIEKTNKAAGHERLVSVIIPAYNHEKYIGDSVGSVLTQSYGNIELIFIDDHSADRTYDRAMEVVGQLEGANARKHTIIRNERNLGVCRTLNKGLTLVSGDYVFVLHSDNYLHRDCIRHLVAAAEQNEEFDGLFICDYFYINVEGAVTGSYEPNFLGRGVLDRNILLEAMFAESGNELRPVPYLTRRGSLAKGGGFDEKFGVEDFDMYIRYAVGPGMYRVPEKLYYFRTVPKSLGGRANEYADSLVPAVVKYQKGLGKPFLRYITQTQRRTIRVYVDNGFYAAGLASVAGYAREARSLLAAAKLMLYYAGRVGKKTVRDLVPKAALENWRRRGMAR